MTNERREIHYLPAFLMVMLAAFSAICIYFYFQSTGSVKDALQVQVDEASTRGVAEIETNYNEIIRELSFLTRNKLLPVLYSQVDLPIAERQQSGGKFVDWFRSQTKKNFSLIVFVDSEGNELYANKLVASSADISQVEEINDNALETTSVYDVANLLASQQRFSVETVFADGAEPYIEAVAKIKFRGKEGAAIAQLAIDELFSIPPSTVHTLVVQKKTGAIVFGNEDQGFWGKNITGIYPEIESIVRATTDTSSTLSKDIDTAKGSLILCVQYLNKPDWLVISYVKSDRFVASTEKTGQFTLFACFVFFVACGLVVNRLIKRIEEQNKELNDELEKAHEMQMRLMPEASPQVNGFDIAGTCRPATHVGGDFFQYYPTDEDSIVLILADVTGHGMQAAIPTVLFSGILQNEMEESVAPDIHLSRLNRSLHRTLDRRTFICCTMATLDITQNRVTLTNGGCPYPYYYQASTKSITELCLDGFPLGVRSGSQYDSIEVTLEPGDVLVLCSDGIIEAGNQQDIFGFERTAQAIEGASKENFSAKEIITHLMSEVDLFTDSAEQLDDQTIVVLKAMSQSCNSSN